MNRLAVSAMAIAVATIVAGTSADANRQRDCRGYRATIVGPNTDLVAKGNRGVIVGTSHRDVIVGTKRPEWIVGARGRDVICAGRGGDYLFVGAENRHEEGTKLDGGPGADRIAGSFGGDRIYGGSGDDGIDGWFDGDRIVAGSGADFIRGQSGADRIETGSGDDHVEASSGRDVVRGGLGDDNISTGPGNDTAFGGEGADDIHLLWNNDRGFGGPGKDVLGGGPGHDLCVGGPDPDFMTGCEENRHLHRADLAPAGKTGLAPYVYAHRGDPRQVRLRPFAREPAFRRLKRFLRRLQRMSSIDSPRDTKRQLHRSATLTRRVAKVVDNRYAKRRRNGSRVKAVFLQSVERYRFRLVTVAISDEIDRLRWTAPG
jgi:Ca2+-binding RTX toxin-like protein